MEIGRLEQLKGIFEGIDGEQYKTIAPLLPEVAFMEKRLEELRDLPHIRIHPTDKSRQEITAAGKQYKEVMQAYTNVVKILLTSLYRSGGGNAADALLEKLKEFEL